MSYAQQTISAWNGDSYRFSDKMARQIYEHTNLVIGRESKHKDSEIPIDSRIFKKCIIDCSSCTGTIFVNGRSYKCLCRHDHNPQIVDSKIKGKFKGKNKQSKKVSQLTRSTR